MSWDLSIMFGKNPTPKEPQSQSLEATKRTEPASSGTARDGKVQHSILGAGTTLTGDLNSTGDITVEGSIEGNITCRCLTLSGEPAVTGTAIAETVIVSGTFRGEVRAKKVILTKGAKMHGDIFKETLEMHPGSLFEGQVSRLDGAKDGSVFRTANRETKPADRAPEATLTQKPAA